MHQISEKGAFICDMDGVIYHGNHLLDGAKNFVNWLLESRKKFLFLTNASERSPKELKQKLERLGLSVPDYELKVKWVEFPVEEFKKYLKPLPPPVKITIPLSYTVEWYTPHWPNINFTIYPQTNFNDNDLNMVRDLLTKTAKTWNTGLNNGKIHYTGKVSLQKNGTIRFFVNFGSTDSSVFIQFLKALDEIQTGKIANIVFNDAL